MSRPHPAPVLAPEIREQADMAVLGIGHLLTHLPDDDSGWSEIKNEDLLAIYAVYVSDVMKRDPSDWAQVMVEKLAGESIAPQPTTGTE